MMMMVMMMMMNDDDDDDDNDDDDEWWMMNDEWWMMNDEWWMMNDDEWWNDGLTDDSYTSCCHANHWLLTKLRDGLLSKKMTIIWAIAYTDIYSYQYAKYSRRDFVVLGFDLA